MSEAIVSGSLMDVTAKFQCGGCGIYFDVDIEVGQTIPAGWSLFDLCLDNLTGLEAYSLQGGYILCTSCTEIVDDSVTEDRSATEAEVKKALGQ